MSVDLRDIVHRIGAGEVRAGGREAFVPAPGHSRRDRGVHLTLTDSGKVLWVAFNDKTLSHPAMLDYLGVDERQAGKLDRRELDAQRRRREAERRTLEAQSLAFCKTVWDDARPIEGTPAEAYLYSRGLVFDGCPVLRWHDAAPRSKPRTDTEPPPPSPHGAMIACAVDGAGEPRALHATYLTADGRKAFGDRSRLMFGYAAGCAVRLAPVGPDRRLTVAEGIETAGAYSVLTGQPTWATLSTSGLVNFVVPGWIRHLTIAADRDDAKGAGMEAARALAARAQRTCDVEIRPAPEGQDWADVLEAQA